MSKMQTCCFIGQLPEKNKKHMLERLDWEIDHLGEHGVTDFISGGVLGFDTLAATRVIAKRQAGQPVRLIMALPCHDQDASWTQEQKIHYRSLLAKADVIAYMAAEYSDACMEKRKNHMLDRSAYCICALPHSSGEAYEAVQCAGQKGLCIINVAE